MTSRMPDYIRRRVELRQQREAHRREAPPGCRCIDCIGVEGIERQLAAKLAAQAARTGEAPF
jgi:hypothetical protein